MKKIMLLLAVAGVVVCTSCGKELASLDGTRWKFRGEYGSGRWAEDELVFTSDQATFSHTNSVGTNWGFTGTYSYDPPTVTITVNSPDYLEGYKNIGTIKKKTLDIHIHESEDLVMMAELKKQ